MAPLCWVPLVQSVTAQTPGWDLTPKLSERDANIASSEVPAGEGTGGKVLTS